MFPIFVWRCNTSHQGQARYWCDNSGLFIRWWISNKIGTNYSRIQWICHMFGYRTLCGMKKCFGLTMYDPAVCSGRGRCVDNDQCPVQSLQCSGHGSCISPDQCECDDGWTEDDCSITHCFGIKFNEISVCSGRGACIDFNDCQCHDGWRGKNCSLTTCFGMPSEHPLMCSAHGSCISPDQCQCHDGNIGQNCSIPICFGSTSNNSSVLWSWPMSWSRSMQLQRQMDRSLYQCALLTVLALASMDNNDCSITQCFGLQSNHPTVCSSHWQCTSPDKCQC